MYNQVDCFILVFTVLLLVQPYQVIDEQQQFPLSNVVFNQKYGIEMSPTSPCNCLWMPTLSLCEHALSGLR